MSFVAQEMQGTVLLTGVTGGLGGELLPRLLRRHPACQVAALVRGDAPGQAAGRLAEAMDYGRLSPAERARVSLCHGDVSQPRFGLAEPAWRELAARTRRVFHLAASVDFDLPLEASRAANVDSTRAVLAFAAEAMRAGGDFRLNYVSTAYVSGRRGGRLGEEELDQGQAFCNGYEQSKFEAEQLVWQASGRLPLTVYRPSQIIGESRAGRIRKFFGYYEFLKLAERGRMPVLPANAKARPDLVPADYVCEAMLHLDAASHAIGRCYHLTAGLANSPDFERIFGLMYQELAARRPDGGAPARPRMFRPEELEAMASPEELRRFHLSPLKLLLRTYRAYLDEERDFDCAATQAELAAAGIPLPDVEAALRLSTRYALDARFGQPARGRALERQPA
ncbi:SDR family oxidoreductase [Chromobacterium violaceum]|uniref:SDR family oxidoreductase n=1 Tax=Chromobacterium violaceum TaxID=536 RepID=UPI0009DB39A3|nr:SDR family oxidoreductase [Chromobacterium violaceum]MBP4051147.1 SDR family oxidoreductase [Chromobacterium violaceum]